MEIYVLTYGDCEICKAYTSKAKLLEGYLKVCKQIYRKYEEGVKQSVRELEKYYPNMPEKNREDLKKFFQGKEYEGCFTLEELRSFDISFTFTLATLDE